MFKHNHIKFQSQCQVTFIYGKTCTINITKLVYCIVKQIRIFVQNLIMTANVAVESVHCNEHEDVQKFYKDAITYWSNIPPTVNGMLAGFGYISDIDIEGSEIFLNMLFKLKEPPGRQRALDCGAGIGRITKHLLIKYFDKVDLVEQNKKFLDESPTYIGSNTRIGHFYDVGLQDFKPCHKYDIIWCQWVLVHLTDDHLVKFLELCIASLETNGVIVVKENLSSSSEGDIDEVDSSVTRPQSVLKRLFQRAGLHCFRETVQKNFPKGLYSVKMFALRPKDR